jgi:transcription elongation factor Elf1
MGRRKRRKVVKKVIRKIPKIFTCPKCGKASIFVKIKKEENKANVFCAVCNLAGIVKLKFSEEPIDAYNEFIDLYYKGELG